MMRYTKYIAVFILSFYFFQVHSQIHISKETCQVDDPDIRGKYKGDCENGQAHGKGRAQGKYSYKGSFLRGQKQGQGTYKGNTFTYKGGFKNDIYDGKGTLKYSNKTYTYVGYWKSGSKDGQGKLTVESYKYEGFWKNDFKDGQGTIIHSNKTKYVGHWKNDLKHGEGTFHYVDKSIYNGFWKENKRWGKGKLYNKNYMYDGLWVDEKRSGSGTMEKKSKPVTEKYTGYWENDKFERNGQYQYIYKKKTHKKSYSYKGQFKKGLKSGWGKQVWGNGDIYEGQFKKNKAHGYSTYTFGNTKNKFEGEWKNGKRHGKGVWYYSNGDHPKAELWQYDKLQKKLDYKKVRKYLDDQYNRDYIVKIPPKLVVIDNAIQLDPNKPFEQNETFNLIFDITNQGKGKAQSVHVNIEQEDYKLGFEYEEQYYVGTIQPSQTIPVTLKIKTNQDLKDGIVTFIIKIIEKNGYDATPIKVHFNTKGFKKPKIVINSGYFVKAGQATDFNLEIQNQGAAKIGNLKVKIDIYPQGQVDILNGVNPVVKSFTNMPSGQIEKVKVRFKATPNSLKKGIENRIQITDNEGYINISKDYSYKKNQDNTILIEEGHGNTDNQNVVLISDIDEDLPVVRNYKTKSNAIAIVLGVRNYTNINDVDYALHDAKAMKLYLTKVLGFQEKNIIYRENPTLGVFYSIFGGTQEQYGEIGEKIKKGETEVFMYYSGHGTPSKDQKTSLILPADLDNKNIESTGYALNTIYNKLNKLQPKSLTIIIDGCFSGERTGMFKGQRPVIRIDSNNVNIFSNPNYVLLTASRNDQYANSYTEQKHGLFTYFFLKAIQNKANLRKGSITHEDLFNYIKSEMDNYLVEKQINGEKTRQDPQIYGGGRDKTFVRYK